MQTTTTNPEVSAGVNRKEAISKLITRKWYKKSEPSLRKELLNLPEDFDGFLKDLGERPEMIGNLEILKLKKISWGNYIIVPVFEVRSNLTNEIFTYEYASWKMGQETGSRGIIFLAEGSKLKYFLIKKSDRFPLAKQIFDAIGTFFSKDVETSLNLSGKIEKQMKNMLKMEEVKFEKIIDLGRVYPDAGLINEAVSIFAAIIDLGNKPEALKDIENRTYDRLRVKFEIQIEPIERLDEMVTKTDDSYFLSAVARLKALKLI